MHSQSRPACAIRAPLQNIFALVRQLGIEKDLFTPFLPSAFYNRRGLVTQAPVFSQQQRLPAVLGAPCLRARMRSLVSRPPGIVRRFPMPAQAAPVQQHARVPSAGQFAYTFNLFPGLPLADRASIIPFLYSAIDLHSTPGSYER